MRVVALVLVALLVAGCFTVPPPRATLQQWQAFPCDPTAATHVGRTVRLVAGLRDPPEVLAQRVAKWLGDELVGEPQATTSTPTSEPGAPQTESSVNRQWTTSKGALRLQTSTYLSLLEYRQPGTHAPPTVLQLHDFVVALGADKATLVVQGDVVQQTWQGRLVGPGSSGLYGARTGHAGSTQGQVQVNIGSFFEFLLDNETVDATNATAIAKEYSQCVKAGQGWNETAGYRIHDWQVLGYMVVHDSLAHLVALAYEGPPAARTDPAFACDSLHWVLIDVMTGAVLGKVNPPC